MNYIEEPDGTVTKFGRVVGRNLREAGEHSFAYTDLSGREHRVGRGIVLRADDPRVLREAQETARQVAAERQRIQLEAEQLAQLARFRRNLALVDQLGAEADRLGISRTHLVELMRAENYDLEKLLAELPTYSIGTFARTYWQRQAAQRPNGGA